MKTKPNMLFYAGTSALFMILAALLFIPTREVTAIQPAQEDPQDCLSCHAQAGKLWESSPHKNANVSCIVCHKLADGAGAHPEFSKFTVESEETTCLLCHSEVTGENRAGEFALSQHGQIGLTCISCHEQHSQGLKLAVGSRTVCENCHKTEMRTMLESTHFAAGLSCVNCHMGEDKNHTLVVSVTTCDECHTDLHEAKRMLDAGLEIRVMDQPEAMVEITPVPEEQVDPQPEAQEGGVTLPSWVFVITGVLIGGIISWAVFGREPGGPPEGKAS